MFWFSFVCHLVALILSCPRTPAAASGAGFGGAAAVKSVRPAPGILARGAIAKRTVRTTLVIFDAPAFQDNARFVQIAEEFAVEAFIARLVVKALNVSVLPRAPGLDVKRLDLLGLQPVLDAGGDKLWAVVAAQVLGHSVAGYGCFDHRDHIDGSDRPRRMNRQALPGVFVQQGEDAKAAAIFLFGQPRSPSSKLGLAAQPVAALPSRCLAASCGVVSCSL